MKTQFVIENKNLPARLPLFQTFCAGLAMDYWNAPGWLWGAVVLLFVIIWIAAIVKAFSQKVVDIFHPEEEDSNDESKKKSNFQERLEQKLKQQ